MWADPTLKLARSLRGWLCATCTCPLGKERLAHGSVCACIGACGTPSSSEPEEALLHRSVSVRAALEAPWLVASVLQ